MPKRRHEEAAGGASGGASGRVAPPIVAVRMEPTMTLAEVITKGRRRGKPMKSMSSAARRRKARDKQRLAAATSVADEAELEESREAAEAAAVRPSLAPQVQFDPDTGRIIIDEGTLTHVRQNPSNRAAGTLGRAVDSSESIVTSASYTNRTPVERWTAEQTRTFYKGLGIFGSDFSMIGKVLFHGTRDRRQVKNKFKREERDNPAAIDAALNRRDPMPPPPPPDKKNERRVPAIRDEVDDALADELGEGDEDPIAEQEDEDPIAEQEVGEEAGDQDEDPVAEQEAGEEPENEDIDLVAAVTAGLARAAGPTKRRVDDDIDDDDDDDDDEDEDDDEEEEPGPGPGPPGQRRAGNEEEEEEDDGWADDDGEDGW